MKILPTLPRLAVGVVVAALLTSACAATVAGEPAPQSDPPSTRSAPPSSRSSDSPVGSCQVRVSSTGSISSSGSGGRTVTVNGRTSFSCGSGPLIGIEAIDASGVTFSADGVPVTVAPGEAATVGPYQVTVSSVDSGDAEFRVEPAG